MCPPPHGDNLIRRVSCPSLTRQAHGDIYNLVRPGARPNGMTGAAHSALCTHAYIPAIPNHGSAPRRASRVNPRPEVPLPAAANPCSCDLGIRESRQQAHHHSHSPPQTHADPGASQKQHHVGTVSSMAQRPVGKAPSLRLCSSGLETLSPPGIQTRPQFSTPSSTQPSVSQDDISLRPPSGKLPALSASVASPRDVRLWHS